MSACIFCGQQRKLSEEHIFPRWLQRYLKIEKKELCIYTGSPPELKRRLSFQNHVNGHVCQVCNNGWMGAIEVKVKPIIISLLEDKTPREISQPDTQILAWWILKTILTLHSASPYDQVIPTEHYTKAHQKIAPADMMMAIGQLKNPIDSPAWIQSQNWLGAEQYFSGQDLENALRTTYRITIGFGQFAARVHYFPLNVPLFPLEDGVQFIHPRSRRIPIIWPPRASIDDLWELDRGLVVRPPLDQPSLNELESIE